MSDVLIDRPVFVIGVDHSGTTIFYRMLARHPELAWLSQYSLRDGTIPGRARVPLNGWINRTGRRLTDFTWRKRHRIVRPEPKEGTATWRALVPETPRLLHAEDCTDEMARRVRAAIRSELEAWRLDRVVFKIPYLTRAVLLLDHILPDAHFLHIVRDGRAVALSTRELFAEEGRSANRALRAAAANWVMTVEYVERCAEVLDGRLWTVRYEDLCVDVHGTVAEAWRFCGLEPVAQQLDPIPSELEPTNERRFLQSTQEDRATLNEVLAGTLERWGYAPFAGIPSKRGLDAPVM